MVEPDKIPYKKGTLAYNLIVDDWSDLTAVQIAEVLGCPAQSVRTTILNIRKRTGYQVPYVKLGSCGKPLKQPEEENQ